MTRPTKDAVVNGKTVTIIGKTQARSSLVAKNLATNAHRHRQAADDGAFKLVLPVANRPQQHPDHGDRSGPEPGAAVLSVNRGAGKLRAEITASRYQFVRKRLPDGDADGRR